LWKRGFHCVGLFDGALLDTIAMIRRKAGESLLESANVEEGNWKWTDAAAGAAGAAGNFTEQGGAGPLKPVIGSSVQRSRIRQSGIEEPV
jgi:hypothetical protein